MNRYNLSCSGIVSTNKIRSFSASDFNLVEEKGDKAIVEFNLHNCGSITKVRLEMVRERGDWFIDNFIDLDNAINWKEEMKDYLK